MAIESVWNVQWLNENSQRNYPISEEATLKDTSGSFSLPLNFIVDMVWPVQASATIESDKFHIHTISVFGEGVTLSIGYDGTSIGAVSIAKSTHTTNQSYFISGTGDFYDSIGKVTIGSVDNLVSSGGSYTFDVAGARLEPTVIRPNLKGVSSIVAVSGSESSSNLVGDVEIESGRNIQFTVTQPVGGNPRIRIDAVGSSNLTEECECGNTNAGGIPIQTINGVVPDASGNIQLTSEDECLDINSAGDNVIVFTDQCSKSCCGCEELETIVTDLNLLNSEVSTLDNIIGRLDEQVAAAVTNLIASKTNERSSS